MTTEFFTVPCEFFPLIGLDKVLGKATPTRDKVILTTRPFDFNRRPLSIVSPGGRIIPQEFIQRTFYIGEDRKEDWHPTRDIALTKHEYHHLLQLFAVVWQDCSNIIIDHVCTSTHPEHPETTTVQAIMDELWVISGWSPGTVLAVVEWQAWVSYNSVRDVLHERYRDLEQDKIPAVFRNPRECKLEVFAEPKLETITEPGETLPFLSDGERNYWKWDREIIWLNPTRATIDWKKVRRCVEEHLRLMNDPGRLAEIAISLKTNIKSALVQG